MYDKYRHALATPELETGRTPPAVTSGNQNMLEISSFTAGPLLESKDGRLLSGDNSLVQSVGGIDPSSKVIDL